MADSLGCPGAGGAGFGQPSAWAELRALAPLWARPTSRAPMWTRVSQPPEIKYLPLARLQASQHLD
ncbi:hypothetical protein [Sphaerisporangium album]|uniref:hypothetical protein n=1 Tax=Sphaerisporangium album TaxID=509200 RepID=UPI0011C01CFC|nr:hypothetical protein [Sphaerisporangium album]